MQGGPESKTSQPHRLFRRICKTSIPGSNPGGASKILRKFAPLVRAWRNLALAGVPKLRPLNWLMNS
jgi:hypothetical protein